MTDTLHLVEQHRIGRDHPLWRVIDAASIAPKNIYNAANYQLRQAHLHESR